MLPSRTYLNIFRRLEVPFGRNPRGTSGTVEASTNILLNFTGRIHGLSHYLTLPIRTPLVDFARFISKVMVRRRYSESLIFGLSADACPLLVGQKRLDQFASFVCSRMQECLCVAIAFCSQCQRGKSALHVLVAES